MFANATGFIIGTEGLFSGGFDPAEEASFFGGIGLDERIVGLTDGGAGLFEGGADLAKRGAGLFAGGAGLGA